MTERESKPGLRVRRRPQQSAEETPQAGGAEDSSAAAAAEPSAKAAAAPPAQGSTDDAAAAAAAAEQRAAEEAARKQELRDIKVHAAASAEQSLVSSVPLATPPAVMRLSSPSASAESERARQPAAKVEMPTTDDFAALFESTSVDIRSWHPGDEVKAQIHTITDSAAFLDLGGKMEGVIELHELRGPDGQLKVKVGDMVEGWVIHVRGGTVEVSRALGRDSAGVEALEMAKADGIPVEGKVAELNKGGYVIDILGARAFCPLSQIELAHTEDPSVHIGQVYSFLVERVEEGGRNVVVSRAALQRRERSKALEELLERLRVGDEVEGKISRVAPFGVFVEIAPGVEGLVHVSEIAHFRVEDPSEMFNTGELVRALVLQIQQGSSERDLRISLSLKALQKDPFEAAAMSINIGQSISGSITRLAPFGAFVEIAPGVEGLVHISELGTGRRINHPREVVIEGQQVEVQVLDIDPQRRQFRLSMKAAADDPWAMSAGTLQVGARVQGNVSGVESFGVFIDLPQGLTGLLPLSELSDADRQNPRRRFADGAAVELYIINIEPSRKRLTLSEKEPEDSVSSEDIAQINTSSSFGTMAAALQKFKKSK